MRIKSKALYLLKSIASLRFSISLFLILAFVSILGTVIEQDQPLGYYKLNYSGSSSILFLINWRQIIGFGLNHVYSTYWFLVLLFLFFFSLLLCTFSTQLPMLKIARRWSFLRTKTGIESKKYCSNLKYCSILNLAFTLSLKKYYIFHKGAALYAYKGLVGRLAPIFVHAGIILTLTGSVLGFTNGFIVQEIVPSSEIFHVQNFVKSGYCSSASYNLLARVDDFFLTFHQDSSVRQFFSNVSLIDNYGNIFLKKSLSVNRPLRFNGLTFYQTDWRIDALRVKIGSNYQLVKPLRQGSLSGAPNSQSWFCDLALDDKRKIFIVISNLDDRLYVYNEHGLLIHMTHYGLRNIIHGVPVVFKDLIASTGLQIKTDPGIALAYFGFLTLMISMLLSYISYSQIWASKHVSILYVAGETNRALLAFEDEIYLVRKNYADLF